MTRISPPYVGGTNSVKRVVLSVIYLTTRQTNGVIFVMDKLKIK